MQHVRVQEHTGCHGWSVHVNRVSPANTLKNAKQSLQSYFRGSVILHTMKHSHIQSVNRCQPRPSRQALLASQPRLTLTANAWCVWSTNEQGKKQETHFSIFRSSRPSDKVNIRSIPGGFNPKNRLTSLHFRNFLWASLGKHCVLNRLKAQLRLYFLLTYLTTPRHVSKNGWTHFQSSLCRKAN